MKNLRDSWAYKGGKSRMEFQHIPVLYQEVLDGLDLKKGGTYVDGTVGGGGLGDIAIRYGYYSYQTDIMLVTIVILVVLVQILQGIGMMLSRKLDKRKA